MKKNYIKQFELPLKYDGFNYAWASNDVMSLEINYSGVRYKPEHGSATTILKFDKFFNLNAAL